MSTTKTTDGVPAVLSTDGLAVWPKDALSGRFLCSPEKPMPQNAKGQWMHTGATWIKESYDCCSDKYRCRDCGVEWWVECPD